MQVFVRRRMACPGCAMAPFMTLAEAAASYGLDPQQLVSELEAAMDKPKK
jgi:hybrid cluster-associated redox disulfide protein